MSNVLPLRRAHLLALLTGLLAAVSTSVAQSPRRGDAGHLELVHVDSTRVDSVFAEFDRTDSPGCALGIIHNGRLAYARGYGMADLERAAPITARTIFDIGSTSKQFTAASVALLAGDGLLSLDDDVRKHLPELPDYGSPISIRNLLQHTSGVRDYIGLLHLAGLRYQDLTTDEEALAAIVRQKATDFRPGTEHAYSNSGYFLASLIVERVSGKSLREFAHQRIFMPLGMTHTLFRDDHALVVPGRATAYSPADSGGFEIDMSNWEQTGDGAIHTSIEDLVRWDSNFYTPSVGSQQLLQHLLTPGRLANGEPLTYALGLIVDEYRGVRRVQHGGSWAGYRAQFARFPERRTSVAVLCNLSPSNPSALVNRVTDIVLAGQLQPASIASQSADTSEPPPGTRDAAAHAQELARYTGMYFDEATSALRRVTVDSGRLVLHLSGISLPLRRVGDDRFQSTRYPVTVTFRAARPGGPLQLVETIDGDPAATFEAMAAGTVAAEALAQYAGTYDSEELASAWTLTISDGGLLLDHRSMGETRLEPAFTDAFTAGPALLRFTRGADGRLTGFSVSIGRARNIGFVRRAIQ